MDGRSNVTSAARWTARALVVLALALIAGGFWCIHPPFAAIAIGVLMLADLFRRR